MPLNHALITAVSSIRDPRVLRVLDRLNALHRLPPPEAFGGSPGKDAEALADCGFSIHLDQSDLICLLCRGMGARRVVDDATSIGMSAIYFAAAVRDNGGRLV